MQYAYVYKGRRDAETVVGTILCLLEPRVNIQRVVGPLESQLLKGGGLSRSRHFCRMQQPPGLRRGGEVGTEGGWGRRRDGAGSGFMRPLDFPYYDAQHVASSRLRSLGQSRSSGG